MLINCHLFTHTIEEETDVSHASPVDIVEPDELEPQMETAGEPPQVNTVMDGERQCGQEESRKKLVALLESELADAPQSERSELTALLQKHHSVFSLDKGERGETTMIEMHINTGDAIPKKQPMRRVPFAVRQEVAKQLLKMQRDRVIQSLSSPWASAIVLVHKKDGALHICVDYCHQNPVTKQDTFLLPRIDDLFDQLGSAKYFIALDLAAGYWQIRMAHDSIEKTTFVTTNELFEFQVMPFHLTNVSAILQRLMQQVLSGLNPVEGPDFVSGYIDDLLIFSRTIEEHLFHVGQVLDCFQSAGLKLHPGKCHFLDQCVEHHMGSNPTQRESVPSQTSPSQPWSPKCTSSLASCRTISNLLRVL